MNVIQKTIECYTDYKSLFQSVHSTKTIECYTDYKSLFESSKTIGEYENMRKMNVLRDKCC